LITLVVLKSGLSDRIFDTTSNSIISHTFPFIIFVFNVTIGISTFLESGGKNTTGQPQVMSSLLTSHPSLSVIFTP
jgi:hypothetical protein